jgi:hypothetical protein
MSDKRTMLNGYVKFNGIKIGAGFLRRDNDGYKVSPAATCGSSAFHIPQGMDFRHPVLPAPVQVQ